MQVSHPSSVQSFEIIFRPRNENLVNILMQFDIGIHSRRASHRLAEQRTVVFCSVTHSCLLTEAASVLIERSEA